MSLDVAVIGAGCGVAKVVSADHLCRSDIAIFKKWAQEGALTVACTQEATHFTDLAGEENLNTQLSFVNIRETAGWAKDGAKAGPKIAALLAGTNVVDPPVPHVTFESEGVALLYGRDEVVLDLALKLKDRLDITVLVTGTSDLPVPHGVEFPIRRGTIRTSKGHLGAFELTVEGLAEPKASSRRRLEFGPRRSEAATSFADVVIDVSGGTPLFSASDLREGYLRADPKDALAVERLAFAASDLIGTFDKPRYIDFKADICAHSRSKITGCTRCLDLCPAGAITPNGNAVTIDPFICGGCGACASACPTGAASYVLPTADLLISRLRLMVNAYHLAGGMTPVLLAHDGSGAKLIDALARYGDGLPAHVIPFAVNETGQLGLEIVAAAFAYGACGFHMLIPARPKHAPTAIERTILTINTLLTGLGFGADLVTLIATDDPDQLAEALAKAPLGKPAPKRASFLAAGGKRDILKLALRELHRASPSPIDLIALPPASAFGAVAVKTEGCTLCHACVTACPTGALTSLESRPALRFDESLCVQCGLCQATCPEKVINLTPQLDFTAFEAGTRTLKEEEPYCCVNCGKAFGTKSSIERVLAKLEGKHWMFAGANAKRLDLIRMCEDCRIEVSMNESIDPYGAPARPKLRTSEDYFRERDEKAEADKREAEMIERIKRGEV